jgi:23S rRNA pseudouridine2457 synthase
VPLILLNKPYQVLSQFTDTAGRATLQHLVEERQVYPAGRLDFDSEGLLLLTEDGGLLARISRPASKLPKFYCVQVEGRAAQEQVQRLLHGVELRDGRASAVHAEMIDEPAGLWPRHPPIRERRAVPVSWLTVAITTGRNRQVRRMTAAVGLPTLRLIRYRIGPFVLDRLAPGETRRIDLEDAWTQLDAWGKGRFAHVALESL